MFFSEAKAVSAAFTCALDMEIAAECSRFFLRASTGAPHPPHRYKVNSLFKEATAGTGSRSRREEPENPFVLTRLISVCTRTEPTRRLNHHYPPSAGPKKVIGRREGAEWLSGRREEESAGQTLVFTRSGEEFQLRSTGALLNERWQQNAACAAHWRRPTRPLHKHL